jgi:hypothetical protein
VRGGRGVVLVASPVRAGGRGIVRGMAGETDFPRGRDTVCPPWCARPADHAASEDYVERKHLRTVTEIQVPEIDGIREDGERPLTVWLEAWVDWDRKEWPPVVSVSLSGSGSWEGQQDLTAGEARALAAALEQAADLLDGVEPPR